MFFIHRIVFCIQRIKHLNYVKHFVWIDFYFMSINLYYKNIHNRQSLDMYDKHFNDVLKQHCLTFVNCINANDLDKIKEKKCQVDDSVLLL